LSGLPESKPSYIGLPKLRTWAAIPEGAAMAGADFIRTVAAAALGRFDQVADWLGLASGKNQGREYLPLNPKRADTKAGSFTINRDSGAWSDFATGDKGGDLVSLCAYLHSIKQGAAADKLADFLGIEKPDGTKRPTRPATDGGKVKASPATVLPHGDAAAAGSADVCMMPIPADALAPPATHSRHGKPSRRWAYTTADGAVNFYHDRYEPKVEGERKQFAPLTLWRTPAGRLEWRYKAPTAPRPPYGLPSLTRPGAAVLTEGEKAAGRGRATTAGSSGFDLAGRRASREQGGFFHASRP
jgi:putative DNA primase/helicase